MNIFTKSIIVVICTNILHATIISGIGYGNLNEEAKKEALADLSNKISVDVKSNFKAITKSIEKEYSKSNEKLITLSSNLPILGASFDEIIGDTFIKSIATIDSKTALSLYKMELKRLHKNITHNLKELKTVTNDEIRYKLLNQTLKDVENFNKHKIVATLLKGKNLETLSTTKSQITTELLKYIQSTPSLQIASDILTQNIKQKKIYISTIKPSGSSDVTQLARLLKNQMATKLHTTKKPSDAQYFLRGEYEILSNSIFITLNLSDINNNIIKTNTVTLAPSAYKSIQYKPTTKTFDTALNSDFIKSGKLQVQIGFKGYNRANGIDLYEDDLVDIVVKTNKSMCYFLVGHTLKENEKFSYLLPIGSDENPFINRITGDDINKNIIIIDEVPIEAPFGSESLQIFASTFTKNRTCPLIVPKASENQDGYFVIDGNPATVVRKTRALNIKKKKFTVEKNEANINFTSFEK